MEGQPVTTNPVLIMLINMTIVFAVLIVIGVLIEVIHQLDPTKVKKAAPAPAPAPVPAPAPAPKPQPAAAPAPVVDAAAAAMEEKTVRAVITAALMASGYKAFDIVSIRRMD